MGAFGPKRVVTADNTHTPAAPYPVVNNNFSLLDVSDLVFVDAPGTGFSRIAGKDREKAFYGMDAGRACLCRFHRAVPGEVWTLEFAEISVRRKLRHHAIGGAFERARDGARRGLQRRDSAVADIELRFERGFAPEFNPGIDLPYQLALPTYAASAWYHHKLADTQQELAPLLEEVEQFAMGEYAQALGGGIRRLLRSSGTRLPRNCMTTRDCRSNIS